jgi:hypothetical protein
MLGVTDPYEAFCIDEAIVTFGNWVKYELEKVKGKNEKELEGRRLLLLRRLLSDKVESRFANPMATT